MVDGLMERFDTVLAGQTWDPRHRNRMLATALLALGVSTGGAAAIWVTERLSIERMMPPENAPERLSFHRWRPPPPAEPSPRPKAASERSVAAAASGPRRSSPLRSDSASEGDSAPSDTAPLEAGDDDSGAAREAGGVGMARALSSGGGKCRVPPCVDVPARPGPVDGPPSPGAFEPVAVVRARALFSPDPAHADLQRARGIGRGPVRGRSTVSFCIRTDGRVERVRTTRPFGGQPDVDAVCRETVSRWRFRPMRADGRAKVTCSEVTFEIAFEPG